MNQFYITIVIGLIFIIMELATTSFYLLIVGISVILSGMLYLVFHLWFPAIIISAIFATIAIILLNVYKKTKNNNNHALIINHIGQEVIVTSVINKEHFIVSYSGTTWNGFIKKGTNEINIGDILIISSLSNGKFELIKK